MITLERAASQTVIRSAEFNGNSTDEKPTEYSRGHPIENGSTFYEMDTGEYYRFDKKHMAWIKQ